MRDKSVRDVTEWIINAVIVLSTAILLGVVAYKLLQYLRTIDIL